MDKGSTLNDQAQFFAERGYGRRLGFGTNPAVLIVDLQCGFTDTACPLGANLDAVVASCRTLVDAARSRKIPVFFAMIAYAAHGKDAGIWGQKIKTLELLTQGSKWTEIDPRLGKLEDDVVVLKKYSSAFFGTHFQSTLTSMAIDSLIIAGATTSGCIRATCVDASQYGYRAIVPEDCVGDRAQGPHQASLFDIDQKYGDVMQLGGVLSWMERYRRVIREA